MNLPILLQWSLVIIPSILFFLMSPLAKTKEVFFKAQVNNEPPSFIVLTGSLIISWIFAKSITNAANLGYSFGIVGGVAYAMYYVSFFVAGIVIFKLRSLGFTSIHHFLQTKFGKGSLLLFSLLIGFRLFNEIWSNTMVIGSYFGEQGSWPYYISIIVFTILTLSYVIKGGLSSSILSDLIQMFLFVILLFVILHALFSNTQFTVTQVATSGVWSLETGGNLILAALLQVLSYPFHDPVMTDRGFISNRRVTLKAFFIAGTLGMILIILFSIIGIYAQELGATGQAAVIVAKSLGIVTMLAINFIMITSAASTMDSTFSSFAKLIAFDLKVGSTVSMGRIAMILLAVFGSIPVFLGAEVLAATTVSGTMVMGLAPIFILYKFKVPRISFYLAIITGIFYGIVLLFKWLPVSLYFSNGPYAELLWVNFYGLISCFIVYLTPTLFIKKKYGHISVIS